MPAAAVFVQIADYFKKMHDDVVWPTMKAQPAAGAGGVQPPVYGGDKLLEFQRAFVVSYAKAVRIFNPRRSQTVDGCHCGEFNRVRVDAGAHPADGPVAPVLYADSLQPCTGNDDCLNQDEICVDGFCVKKPYGVMGAQAAFNPDTAYYQALEKSVVSYYAEIQDVLAGGLSKKPSRLGDVRNFLMEMYADLAEVAAKLPCGPNNPCGAGTVCVKGHCVPYPFRIVFHVPGTLVPPPWEP